MISPALSESVSFFEIEVQDKSCEQEVAKIADELLANPIIEEYSIEFVD